MYTASTKAAQMAVSGRRRTVTGRRNGDVAGHPRGDRASTRSIRTRTALPFLIAVLLAAVSGTVLAQAPLQVQLVMSPNPSPYLSDWQERTETVRFLVVNTTNQSFNAKIVTRVSRMGSLIAETKTPQMNVLAIGPRATATYDAEHLIPLRNVTFYGADKDVTVRSGKIPAGDYQICVMLVDALSGNPLSVDQCRPFRITSYQAPTLLAPNDKAVIPESQSRITMRWTPVIPQPPAPITYRVMVFEVLPGQQPLQAFRANRPILDRPVSGQTQMIWPLDVELPSSGRPGDSLGGRRYVWSVEARDDRGNAVGDPPGPAPPFTFSLVQPASNCLCVDCVLRGIVLTVNGGPAPEAGCVPGDRLGFTPDVITGCAPSCPVTIGGTWRLLFTPTDGAPTTINGMGPSITWSPDASGELLVEFTGTFTRGAVTLTCSGRTVSLVVRCTTGSRAPKDSLPPEYPVPVVDTTRRPPPDSIPYLIQCGPTTATDPATPVSLGIALEEAATFLYPRAVPIRGKGIDQDYAIFKCFPCVSTPGERWIPVPDRVRFTWKLLGKGSLNTPFDAAAITDLEEEIDSLATRQKQIERAIDSLNQELDSLPDRFKRRREKAEKELKDIDAAIARIDSISRVTTDSLARLRAGLKVREKGRADTTKLLEADEKTIESNIEKIAELDSLIAGKPSAAERAKQEEVTRAEDELEKAREDVDAKRKEIIAESERLRSRIETTAADVVSANEDWISANAGTEALTKEIAALQTKLYSGGPGKKYFETRRDWSLKAATLLNDFFPSDPLKAELAAMQNVVNEAAQSTLLATGAVPRAVALKLFKKVLDDLSKRFLAECTAVAEADRKRCKDAAMIVNSAGIIYEKAVSKAESAAYKIDPAVQKRIKEDQEKLKGLESTLAAAEKTVKDRNALYESAVAEHASTMERLESEATGLESAAAAKSDALAVLESEHREMVDKRESELLANGARYIEERTALDTAKARLIGETDELRDVIAGIDRDTAELHRAIEIAESEAIDLAATRKRYEAARKLLLDLLAIREEDLRKAISDAIEELEKEKTDVEDRLAELRKKLEELKAGAKEATGELVYYIPPPLEELITDQKIFTEMKDAVERAETALAKARDAKADAQRTMFGAVESIARGLVSYRRASDEVAALKKELEGIDREITALKNAKTREYQDAQSDLQEKLEKAEESKAEAEKKYKEAKEAASRLKKEVDKASKDLEDAAKKLEELEVKVNDMRAQRNFEQKQWFASKGTLEDRATELEQEKSKQEGLDRTKGRAEQELSRAGAREDQARIAGAKAKVATAKGDVKLQATKIDAASVKLRDAAGSHKAADTRATLAEDMLTKAAKEYLEQDRKVRDLKDTLDLRNDRLQAIYTYMARLRKIIDQAQDSVDKANEDRRDYQDEVAKAVGDDEEVKEKIAEKETLPARIKEAEEAARAAREAIGVAKRKKEDIEKKIKEDYEKATADLEDAQKKLREYLKGEFDKVAFETSIELEGEDEVIDGWRSKDGGAKISTTLTYAKRLPTLPSSEPKGGLGEKRIAGDCNPAVSFFPLSGIAPEAPSIKRTEPRTIALLYKGGSPLWLEWPVIPGAAPILSKDVVFMRAAGTDNDEYVHGCAPQAPDCIGPPPVKGVIADLVTYDWEGEGRYINGTANQEAAWEAPDIDKPQCKTAKKVETKYNAKSIAPDGEKKEMTMPEPAPAVLIEVPEEIVGVAGGKDTAVARLVRGDHKGLEGEDVEFTVTLVSGGGAKEDYGFGGGKKTITQTTDPNGYARAPFEYGSERGTYTIKIDWKRGCDSKSISAKAPLYVGSPGTELEFAL